MIIKSPEITPGPFNFDNIAPGSAGVFPFELELPDFDGTMAQLQEDEKLIKMMGSPEKQVIVDPSAQVQLAEARKNLAKSLQELALKDQITVRMRRIDDIKLFINSRELYGVDEGYKINLDSLSGDDVEFFKLCAEKGELTINDINSKDSQVNLMSVASNNRVSYKSLNFSKGLFNLIEYSFRKQKPIRLDFRGNSSVILRVNPQGNLSAEFIANDTAMEHILRSSIPNLKNKLDSEGVPYEKIVYRENQEKNKKNKGGKK